MNNIDLRYGINPHQKKEKVYSTEKLFIKILNGEASYINFLDALNAFQLVRELKQSTGQPAAVFCEKNISLKY
ncbi:hypothetical protein [Bacillus thuringiensis]|uniref:Uncharacterized protein n=1 Tax=Bacillus thuringiensis TaxID=1428 RepID=A0A9X7BH77_BACTU|nr:hypothetical protein [Bacillus thuringiensis]MED4446121.1 hypothetical protein [Bacillus cereus]PEB45239.1 hypothetical protein COM82_23080 [Bacillus thuringiensis]PED25681.1 hypothetical protein CON34_14100 [Bacillus thuringiensis]PFL08299.1 hypothetical protein COJ28_11185 [Bacillus thuringiensis]PFV22815.1 hypothetical protein COK99_31720 [Bacillus thuringiensis]